MSFIILQSSRYLTQPRIPDSNDTSSVVLLGSMDHHHYLDGLVTHHLLYDTIMIALGIDVDHNRVATIKEIVIICAQHSNQHCRDDDDSQ